jgi:tight adherence protein C
VLTFGLICVGVAVALGLWAVLSQVEEKAVIRSSLRQLEGYDVQNVRDQELLQPLSERAFTPLLERLTDIGNRLSPDGYRDAIKDKFVRAGRLGPDSVDRFLAIRVGSVVGGLLVAVIVFSILPGTAFLRFLAGLLVIVVFMIGPSAVLDRRIAERQLRLRVDLPNVLDLLVISVEAGLGFEQAIDRTIAAVPGPLTEEFARMIGEIRAGAVRADAMRAMEERCGTPEIRSFVLAILQADKFGVSIGRVLRGQADEMRIKRRQLAQEQAMKIPVKMLFPMVFCIFPALFVVVLGPAIMNIAREFT